MVSGIDDRETWLNEEALPLLRGKALTKDIGTMPLQEIADAWQLLESIKGKIEPRLKALRLELLKAAEDLGNPTDKGGYSLLLGGAEIEKQKKTASIPDPDEVLSLLEDLEIASTEVFDEVKTLVYNPSKAQFLVETGKIPKEDLESKRKVSYALRVKKADEWLGLFQSIPNEAEGASGTKKRRSTR